MKYKEENQYRTPQTICITTLRIESRYLEQQHDFKNNEELKSALNNIGIRTQ